MPDLLKYVTNIGATDMVKLIMDQCGDYFTPIICSKIFLRACECPSVDTVKLVINRYGESIKCDSVDYFDNVPYIDDDIIAYLDGIYDLSPSLAETKSKLPAVNKCIWYPNMYIEKMQKFPILQY